MPNSKQVRAAQERAKTRLAMTHAGRETARRRRRIGGVIGVVVIIAIVAIVAAVIGTNNNDNSTPAVADKNNSAATAATPTTTATLASAKGKPCVAMKGTPPKGAPSVPVEVGPAPTKLVVKDLKVGTGAEATATSTVTADYIGVACTTGKIFGASVQDRQPFTAPLGSGVIEGWTQGIPGMKAGGRRLLGIPSELAYKSEGRPPDIAPDEPLWFVIDLQKVA
jgi:peptidylprolyl isomerase